MTVTEARLRNGTITLGTAPDDVDFSCQVTNIRVGSAYEDDGSAQETLCGDVIPSGRKLSGRSLAGTFIQDWTDPDSITAYCFAHELELVPFTFAPAGPLDGPTITGSARIEVPAETYGGDVNSRITSDFEWQISITATTPPAADAFEREPESVA